MAAKLALGAIERIERVGCVQDFASVFDQHSSASASLTFSRTFSKNQQYPRRHTPTRIVIYFSSVRLASGVIQPAFVCKILALRCSKAGKQALGAISTLIETHCNIKDISKGFSNHHTFGNSCSFFSFQTDPRHQFSFFQP